MTSLSPGRSHETGPVQAHAMEPEHQHVAKPGLHRDLAMELYITHRHCQRLTAATHLHESVFAILDVLSDGRPYTQRDLEAALQLDQSTVSRHVNTAIDLGYVERWVGPSGSRLIRPTISGRRGYEHEVGRCGERLGRVLAELSPGRADALLAELHAFNEACDRHRHT
ncbi:MarR family winged helix-turn-helix transcriptional regulator [Gordonia McavH-238-E]|uniref:MarR family winged helix-turn-helix transcriptional regulator n=1 Tax=Gordonia sp. McavH-238-E TaxID=2917736 RepID=UPI001EF6D886|nr:MarR family winged helix-turn-helix transcriptional regulator [Gordonia sp. McavH-238-E]MCG7631808.1 MarR family winged helix-turn-helix transcriptional regulator [Gordonia sp. McavH-238-E]